MLCLFYFVIRNYLVGITNHDLSVLLLTSLYILMNGNNIATESTPVGHVLALDSWHLYGSL